MVKNTLVTSTLSTEMTEAGKYLLEQLDLKKSKIKSFFWLFFPEEKTWKLMVASPIVEDEGPRNFYKRIVDINREAKEEIISPNNIIVANLNNKIVNLLGFLIGTDDGIHDIRCSGNTINGTYIEDAYIYRSNIHKVG